MIVLLHLQWLYENNYKPDQFGYEKDVETRSIPVIEVRQNAGLDKKQSLSNLWNYKEVIRELER